MEVNLYMFFVVCLYMYCCLGSNYHERVVGISSSGLTPLHIYACPKTEPGYPMLNVMVFSIIMELRREVIVHFLDLGGIVSLIKLSFHN